MALCVTLPLPLSFLLTQDTYEDARINLKEERIESQVNQELEVEKVNNFTKSNKEVTGATPDITNFMVQNRLM